MANPLHAFFLRLALLILVSLSAGPIAKADFPLADRVPGDAVVYVGWAGADSQAVVYRDSNLGAFVDQSNLAELARQYLPGLWKKLAGDSDDNARQAVAALQRALPVIWHHPVALYASHVTIQPDGTPQADVALVCDAGDDAGALKSDLEQAIAGNPQLHVAVRGSVVILGLNQSADAPLDSALAANPKFVATMHKLPGSPAIAVYVDVKTVLQKVDASTAADPDSAEIWPKVRDALGIGGCKTFAMTGGFENHNWITASLLEAPSPRTGLLAAIEPKPIDPVLLSRIPATAETASVCNLDLAKLYDTIGDGRHKTE
jgi:hypothetical protein